MCTTVVTYKHAVERGNDAAAGGSHRTTHTVRREVAREAGEEPEVVLRARDVHPQRERARLARVDHLAVVAV